MKLQSPIVTLLLTLAAAGAHAQPLAVQQQGAVRFVTGGVGMEERAALDAMRADFNVRLTLAVKGTGAYLADVEVAVSDAQGASVLKTLATGPKVYARLAPGAYSVTAAYSGKSQTKRLPVPARGSTEIAFYWDDPSTAEGKEKDWEPERRGAAKRK
jgi:hypothetical protein